MTKIKFYKGLRSSYNTKDHGAGQYFAFDTGEILVNGKAYGGVSLAQFKTKAEELGGQINDITSKLAELEQSFDQGTY